jgi:hypothetical protein
MVVTKVLHALTFVYVQTNRKMMPPYLSDFFGACYVSWKRSRCRVDAHARHRRGT